MDRPFDLIVVGAGLAGAELAALTALGGQHTLLLTTSMDTIFNVARTPVELSMHDSWLAAPYLREHGDVVESNYQLHQSVKYRLEDLNDLLVKQSTVTELLVEGDAVVGVCTWEGHEYRAPTVVLAVGSFLHARLTVGELTETAGRLSETAYDDLYDHLVELGFLFEPFTLEEPGDDITPAYTVNAKRFAASERLFGSFALPRFAGLYAVGNCVNGPLTYEQAVTDGATLAAQLTAGGRA